MLIPFSMTLGSSSPHSVYSSFTVPFFKISTFHGTPIQSSTPSSYHLWTTDQPTNPPHPNFFLSCQGFHPHPASSWPPSEVPSSSSLVVRPCPFSMVLYQSTCWPIGHLNHHWSSVQLYLAWGPLSSQVGMLTLYCINLFISIQCY